MSFSELPDFSLLGIPTLHVGLIIDFFFMAHHYDSCNALFEIIGHSVSLLISLE